MVTMAAVTMTQAATKNDPGCWCLDLNTDHEEYTFLCSDFLSTNHSHEYEHEQDSMSADSLFLFLLIIISVKSTL